MENTRKSFNNVLFSSLSDIHNHRDYIFSKKSGLERVLQVLHQSSDTSREARLNHNCRITGLPSCWSYRHGYGNDAVEIKVLSFPMTKISTGWSFVLDIEENGALYISEGKGTARTSLRLSALNAFSPTTREDMFFAVEYLCRNNGDKITPEYLFDFYKEVGADTEVVYSVFDDTEEPCLYKAQQIKGIPETRYLQFDRRFENPNSYDDAINNPDKKHLIMVRWSKKWNCWYADFVFDGEAWGFSCLNDAGSYQVDEGSYELNITDEDTGEIDKDTMGYKISDGLRFELEDAVKAVINEPDAKKGSWIVIPNGKQRSGLKCKHYRKWSEVSEEDRIHIYVAPTGVAKYYDDVEEMDFSPENGDDECPDMARMLEGSCRFKYHHVDTEDEDEDDED